MLKEIHEQPRAIADTLEGRILDNRVVEAAFGDGAGRIFDGVAGVHIIACGTSYHAGMVGRYWLESTSRDTLQCGSGKRISLSTPRGPQ